MKKMAVFLIVFLSAVIGGITELARTAGDSKEKATEVKTSNHEKSDDSKAIRIKRSGSCIVDKEAVADLKKRRDALEELEKKLNAREEDLRAKETAIEERIAEMEKMREELEGARGNKKKLYEERVAKLVEAIEKMSPKAASGLISTLDDKLAVDTMSKLSTQRLAKIMNLIPSKKLAYLSEQLTDIGVRRELLRSPAEIPEPEKEAKN